MVLSWFILYFGLGVFVEVICETLIKFRILWSWEEFFFFLLFNYVIDGRVEKFIKE